MIMTPISKDVKEQVTDRLSKQITKILNSPEVKDLNDKQLELLAKSVVIDNLKEQLKTEVKKHIFDINELKNKWIATFNSEITRINYIHNIEVFLKWLNDKSIIDVKAIDADDYLLFLKRSNLSNGTIRFRIAAVSSFCNYLKRIDVIQNNYFLKINGLPKIKESEKVIPNDNDIETIEKELWNELTLTGKGSMGRIKSARTMIVVFNIIKNHALRIGAFESLWIGKDGKYIADSKSNIVRGKINPECLTLIEKFELNKHKPFADIKTSSLKKQFERFMGRLFKDGKIQHIYSPHDFRHYGSIKFYENTKDIFATMRFLNHKNITTTQIYLKGLGIID
jgi:site-specific recombinase XerC